MEPRPQDGTTEKKVNTYFKGPFKEKWTVNAPPIREGVVYAGFSLERWENCPKPHHFSISSPPSLQSFLQVLPPSDVAQRLAEDLGTGSRCPYCTHHSCKKCSGPASAHCWPSSQPWCSEEQSTFGVGCFTSHHSGEAERPNWEMVEWVVSLLTAPATAHDCRGRPGPCCRCQTPVTVGTTSPSRSSGNCPEPSNGWDGSMSMAYYNNL